METASLWGALPLESKMQTPLTILQEQAAILTKETNGLLEGETTSKNESSKIKSYLRIVAPLLSRYTLSVVRVTHDIFVYPAEIYDFVNQTAYKCDSQEECVRVISEILTSNKLHKALAALIAQSKNEDDGLPF